MAVVTTIAAGVATAAGTALSANARKKAEEKQRKQQLRSIADATALRQRLQQEALDGDFSGRFDSGDIFGSRLDEVDLNESVLESLRNNESNQGIIQRVTSGVNQGITDDSIARAVQFDPNFVSNINNLSSSARSLLRGELPVDVRDEIFRNRAQVSNQVGIPGTANEATLRDLGLSSLDGIQLGGSIFQQVSNFRDQADPLSRHLSTRDFIIDPATQLQVEQANNQIRAAADPAAQALFGLEFQGGREEAFAQSGVKVPVNDTFGAALSGLGSGLAGIGGAFGGSFGGNSGGFQSNPNQVGIRRALPVR